MKTIKLESDAPEPYLWSITFGLEDFDAVVDALELGYERARELRSAFSWLEGCINRTVETTWFVVSYTREDGFKLYPSRNHPNPPDYQWARRRFHSYGRWLEERHEE